MPNSLLQAIKMDLESGYMAVKRKENWEAICSSVILKIIQSKSFLKTVKQIKLQANHYHLSIQPDHHSVATLFRNSGGTTTLSNFYYYQK